MRFAAALVLVLSACAADAPDSKPGDPSNPSNPGNPGNPGDPPGDPGMTTPTTLSVGDFLTAIGHKECDDAFTCKANFPTDAGVTFAQAFGANAQACYTDAAMYFNVTAIQASITAGKIAYDSAAAKQCIDGMGAPTCATYWTQGPNSPAACDTAMVGKVAAGAACTNDFECSGDNICGDTSKKCEAAPQGARVGEAESFLAKAKTASRMP